MLFLSGIASCCREKQKQQIDAINALWAILTAMPSRIDIPARGKPIC
jgi:hypothetical protein